MGAEHTTSCLSGHITFMCATQSAGIKRTVRAQSPWRKNMLPNYAQASNAEQYKDNTARPSNSTEATANPSVGRRKLLCLLANLLSVICEVVGEYQVRFRLCWALVIGGIQELLQTRKNRSTAQHTTLWHRHSDSGGWHRADVHAQCDTIEETIQDCVRAAQWQPTQVASQDFAALANHGMAVENRFGRGSQHNYCLPSGCLQG